MSLPSERLCLHREMLIIIFYISSSMVVYFLYFSIDVPSLTQLHRDGAECVTACVLFHTGSPMTVTVDGSVFEALMHNMIPGKTYQVTVTAVKGLEESDASTDTVTTGEILTHPFLAKHVNLFYIRP